MGFVAAALATRRARRRHATAGFTLVEILVVLVILAIAAGAAAIAYDGNDRDRATREARHFAAALEHAAMRAQVRAETLGASAEGEGWRFWRRDPDSGQWLPVADDDVLAAHLLPNPMTVPGWVAKCSAVWRRNLVPVVTVLVGIVMTIGTTGQRCFGSFEINATMFSVTGNTTNAGGGMRLNNCWHESFRRMA